MMKYPTSLARDFDPADLILRLDLAMAPSSMSPSNAVGLSKRALKLHPLYDAQKFSNGPVSPIPVSSTKSLLLQRPNSRNEDDSMRSASPFSGYSAILAPDQSVWRLLDQHFPNGMSMNDAFIIDVPHYDSSLRQGSEFSSSSPLKNYMLSESSTRQGPSALKNSAPRYSSSFSGESRQNHNKRQATSHRRSLSNPQSPSAISFSHNSSTNSNNTTILMLPKDFNNSSKEKLTQQPTPDLKTATIAEGTTDPPKNTEIQLLAKSTPTSTPLKQPVSNTVSNKIRSTTERVFPSINVLIVEDNKINQKILQLFLRKRKINFQTAVNGEEAIQKWKQGGFHLILMDIQLPVKSGIEATIEIRRLEKLNKIGLFLSPSSTNVAKLSPVEELDLKVFRAPVIIVALTASTSSIDRQKALAAGCNDFLTKPVNLDWLQNKITEWGCMQALIDFDHWKN